MKQFNLEEYLKNPSRKVVTRDGSKVRIICADKKGACPIVALVTRCDGVAEETVTYTKNGKFFNDTSYKYDLFFAPEKHEGWINIYRGALDVTYAGCVYASEKEAKEHIDDTQRYVATVKIEWEEQL